MSLRHELEIYSLSLHRKQEGREGYRHEALGSRSSRSTDHQRPRLRTGLSFNKRPTASNCFSSFLGRDSAVTLVGWSSSPVLKASHPEQVCIRYFKRCTLRCCPQTCKRIAVFDSSCMYPCNHARQWPCPLFLDVSRRGDT